VARLKPSLAIPAVIIAIGISLGLDNLAATIFILVITPIEIIYYIANETPLMSVYHDVVIAVMQLVLFVLLVIFVNYTFKIRRLKKGILFWESKDAVWVGVIWSVLIMVTSTMCMLFLKLYSDVRNLTILYYFLLIIINIFLAGLYFWWRSHTTAVYQQKLKDDIIGENEKQIKNLAESNEILSKTIHRDNKLIPALAMYVAEKEDDEIKDKIAELNEIIKERNEMLIKDARENKTLPSTGIVRIDAILNYMLLKATENDMDFDLVISGSLVDVIGNIISKQNLETLLADLIENAINATLDGDYRRILVVIGMVDGCFEITVKDSGVPFPAEVLADLGKKKVTSRAGKGGSGIGYMMIFEIFRECGASFGIVECGGDVYCFTKEVKVRFDGKGEVNLTTPPDSRTKYGLGTPSREGNCIL